MSEAAAENQQPVQAPGDGLTAGLLLRRARESAGLHVAALAVALKVPVRKLEALEADRYDLLTDAVFARGLAASVCRTLKIDPQPILERLPQSAAPRLLHVRDGINAPFRAPGDATGPSWYGQLPRPVVLAVGALLLGAAVILLWPVGPRDLPGVAMRPPVAVMPAAEPMGQPMADQAASAPAPALSMTLAIPPAGAGAAASVAGTPPAAMPPPPPPSLAAAPLTLPPAPAASTPAPVQTAAQAAAGIVAFRATAPSWVQVTDARGNVVIKKLLAAGESAGVSGALPLAVTVGSANTTRVTVRGQEFDLAPLARDNVARFDIK
jgi:cytoskeleton protein RodZ